jgi:hypothetical protein
LTEKLENKLQEIYRNLVVSKLESTLLNKVINRSINSHKVELEDDKNKSSIHEIEGNSNREQENGAKEITEDKTDTSINEPTDNKQTNHWVRR